MAHAAPASRRAITQRRTPDVFSERTHAMAKVAVPVVLGLVYGYWAAANRRDAGPITGWNLLFGFLTALVFAVLFAAVWQLAPRLRREQHALSWFVFTGCSIGFLYSQTGESVLKSSGVGLVVGAGVLVMLFYRYYSREDATGHRID
jgi:chromate transport protein ChrA